MAVQTARFVSLNVNKNTPKFHEHFPTFGSVSYHSFKLRRNYRDPETAVIRTRLIGCHFSPPNNTTSYFHGRQRINFPGFARNPTLVIPDSKRIHSFYWRQSWAGTPYPQTYRDGFRLPTWLVDLPKWKQTVNKTNITYYFPSGFCPSFHAIAVGEIVVFLSFAPRPEAGWKTLDGLPGEPRLLLSGVQ